jgi:hypothetical protein
MLRNIGGSFFKYTFLFISQVKMPVLRQRLLIFHYFIEGRDVLALEQKVAQA